MGVRPVVETDKIHINFGDRVTLLFTHTKRFKENIILQTLCMHTTYQASASPV